jgi:protein phosphatase
VVTRALGSASGQRPDHWLLSAVTGDRYLVCSDGLFSELPDDAILPLLAAGAPQQAADTLVAAACDAGGHDNVTVVVVDIDAGDDAADGTALVHDTLPVGLVHDTLPVGLVHDTLPVGLVHDTLPVGVPPGAGWSR